MIMYAQIRQLSWSVLHRLAHFSIFSPFIMQIHITEFQKNIINVKIITFLLWRWNGPMGLNMTKINQTPLHYLVMNASCTLFFQLHTFWSIYCQGKTTKYTIWEGKLLHNCLCTQIFYHTWNHSFEVTTFMIWFLKK